MQAEVPSAQQEKKPEANVRRISYQIAHDTEPSWVQCGGCPGSHIAGFQLANKAWDDDGNEVIVQVFSHP